jgi:dipeptidyl aminopeptidase/acylaminoacyl peptidase
MKRGDQSSMRPAVLAWLAAMFVLAAMIPTRAATGEGLTFEQLAAIREVGQVRISPDGGLLAFTVEVPRRIGDEDDGAEWVELWTTRSDGTELAPFIQGQVNVSAVRFSPDGRLITYLAKRDGDEHRSLWAIPVGGGESKRILGFDTAIADYRLSPDGMRVAFIAVEPESAGRKKAKERGYAQEVFEEDWRHRRVWIGKPEPILSPPSDPSEEKSENEDSDEPKAVAVDGAVFDLDWTPDGEKLVLSVAPRPLVDDRYMLRRVGVYDAESGERLTVFDNPGKLGSIAVSPDGRHVAMITAADANDPQSGRLAVAPLGGGAWRDLMPDLEGHVSAMAWRDAETVSFIADIGEETLLGDVSLQEGTVTERLTSGTEVRETRVPVMNGLALCDDGRIAAFVGESPTHPRELYLLAGDDSAPRRLTDNNPWLDGVALAPQTVTTWKARDGLELRGVLVRPLDDRLGSPAPLIMIVHGGPEGHVRNGWVSSYSRPGQLAAAKGYAVFYPNYRGSTGRGVAFSKLGQGDAAGKEFDDLVDAVEHLIAEGIVDRERVGITGGSYGGYATAWAATRLTEHFRAGVMFVGISNKLSKGLTTEIPVEDRLVHTLFDPWTRWQFSLERSPIYHVEQSRTALLIAGGTADSRVHPSQSLQLYRALKLIGKAPVRYVRYPGEGHGNRRAAARDDYARRLMRWMDHFLLDDTQELPPWDLGLGEDSEEEDDEE